MVLADGRPYVILNHKTIPKEQLLGWIIIRCQPKRLDDHWTYKRLVVSGVEHRARGSPEKTGNAGLGCI